MTNEHDYQIISEPNETPNRADIIRQALIKDISRLNRLSTRGILALALFIVVCFFAWQGFSFLPVPDDVTAILGSPPSPRIISIVLLIYTFSAIILSLSRMTAGIEHRSSFSHVGYLTAFFLFYYFDKALEDNYWAVFGSGITILGIESYRIWTFCAEGIARSKEDIDYISRTGKPPPQE